MQNQPVTEELLQKMTEKIVREINPRKVVLFGSHARGTARPDSDLDFLIIEDGPFNAQRKNTSMKAFAKTNISKHILFIFTLTVCFYFVTLCLCGSIAFYRLNHSPPGSSFSSSVLGATSEAITPIARHPSTTARLIFAEMWNFATSSSILIPMKASITTTALSR